MKEIARDVYLLPAFPPAGFNVHLIRHGERWILVDTGSRHAVRRIMRRLPGVLEAIVITHAHHDHAGAMHAVASTTGAPVWAGAADAPALEGDCPEPLPERYRHHLVNRTFGGWWRDYHPASRRLREGDGVADFRVVELPGHTPGHIGLWRERDRTLLCGDAMCSKHFLTGLPRLGELPSLFTVDPDEARRSIRKLVALAPETVCFGHGRPLRRNAAARLEAWSRRLGIADRDHDRAAACCSPDGGTVHHDAGRIPPPADDAISPWRAQRETARSSACR